MRRQLRMSLFHVRQFITVPYFIQVMVVTTVTTTLVQFLAASAWNSISPAQGWVRGGVIGMWTTSTFAAGIIGFERYKGTLSHLVIAPIGALRAIASVVSAAASFGIFALPLSWTTWAILSGSINFTPMDRWGSLRILGGGVMLLIGCLALSLVIAAIFVLTPNAISYEGLLLVPIFIASGIVFTSASPPRWLDVIGGLLPLRLPFNLLLGRPVSVLEVLGWLVIVASWIALAAVLGRRALGLAIDMGSLEVI